jgi:uncharacterized protein YggU (UPF0235/DUF167 family)
VISQAEECPWRLVDDGLELLVKARPQAGCERIGGVRETPQGPALMVDVTVAPEKGRANAAIVALLAKALSVAKSDIHVRRGESGRIKILHIKGDAKDLSRRLEGIMRNRQGKQK